MELRQLEYFKMVSQFNNITRAAEQLHVSQPSVTTAIQKLEDELGVPLFDRSKKRLALTIEGQTFLRRIEAVLQGLQDAVLEMNDYKEFQRGSIKLGIPPMIGSYLFPHIFVTFQKQFPNLHISVTEGGSLSLIRSLEKGNLDVAIVIMSPVPSVLNTLPISTRQILLCLPPEHPFTYRDRVPFPELKDQPLILLKEDYSHRRIIFEECEKYGFEPNVVLSSSQIETIKGLVANGVGSTFLLDVIAHKTPNLVCKPMLDPLEIKIAIMWHKDKYFSKASRAFVEFVTDYFSSPLSPEQLYPSY